MEKMQTAAMREAAGFTAENCVPEAELQWRWARCRQAMSALPEEAGGMLVFSRTDIFYLTGTLANGLCWLPREGQPVLLARKGAERCRLESPLMHIAAYKSYGDVAVRCAEAGSPLSAVIAVDRRAVPWNMGRLLQTKLPDTRFVEGGAVLTAARAVKSPYELERMRRAAVLHREALTQALPRVLGAGMTERHIAHALWDICFALGHGGQVRVTHGEAPFLGSVSAGENGNYPVSGISPTGMQGEHPAMPVMGYAGQLWLPKQPLLVDTAFTVEGYHSDMTVSYWAGAADSVPDKVRRAHEACVEISAACAAMLRPGIAAQDVWEQARQMAEARGVTESFMGLGAGQGGNQRAFIGHGIGLALEEWPALTPDSAAVLEADMTIALEPKIGMAGVGMLGCEQVLRVTEQGGEALNGGEVPQLICCERSYP